MCLALTLLPGGGSAVCLAEDIELCAWHAGDKLEGGTGEDHSELYAPGTGGHL